MTNNSVSLILKGKMPLPVGLPDLAPPVSQFFRAPQPSPGDDGWAAWLNAGGQTPAPQPQVAPDEWTPEDYQIAALSGDPMGVRELVDKYHAADDEQAFMRGLSKIDWSAPSRTKEVNDLLSKSPRGLTNQSMSYMRTMEELNKAQEAKADPYARSVAGGGPQVLAEYHNAVAAGMDPLEAYSLFQAKQDKAKADKAAESAGMLTYISHGGTTEDWNAGLASGKTGPKMLEDQNAEKANKLKAATVPEFAKMQEHLSDYQSASSPVDTKKLEYLTAKYGKQPTYSKDQWTEAYWHADPEARKKAQDELLQKLDPYIKARVDVSPYLPAGVSPQYPAGSAPLTQLASEPSVSAPATSAALMTAPAPTIPPPVVAPVVAPPSPPPIQSAPAVPVAAPSLPPPTPAASAVPPIVVNAPQSSEELKKLEDALPDATGLKRLELLKKQEDLRLDAAKKEAARQRVLDQKLEAKGAADILSKNKEKMDKAMETMLSGVNDIDYVRSFRQPGLLSMHAGLHPNSIAFTTEQGDPITWNQVELHLRQSPEVAKIVQADTTGAQSKTIAPVELSPEQKKLREKYKY